MTIAEESRRFLNDCRFRISRNITSFPIIHGTMNKRSRMYKIANQYKSDADIDFEFGTINKDQYDKEVSAIRLFEQMLANYRVTD